MFTFMAKSGTMDPSLHPRPSPLKRLHGVNFMLVYLHTSIQVGRGECMELTYPEERLTMASTGEKVGADLRMRIIARDIEKDTKLSENQVAREYGVSRSPVRDAFKVLEQEGLIRLERMGAVVVGMSEAGIDEIYDIRLMIESFVFERVLNRDNEALVRELQQIVEMMRVAVKYEDADAFSFKDVAFHEAIVKSIGHHYILMLWSNFRPVMECLILLSMRKRMQDDVADFDRVLANHDLLVEAIEKKDRQISEQAFYQNFNDVLNDHSGFWTVGKGEEKQ